MKYLRQVKTTLNNWDKIKLQYTYLMK